jgi:outer membrane protein assembly factor BamB
MRCRLLLCAACLLGAPGVAGADDYPQWRGPRRDGHAREQGLLQRWPPGGPKLLWKAANLVEAGSFSYSTPVIARGRIFLLGAQKNEETLIALNERDGTRVWTKVLGAVGKNAGLQYPGARSTPTVDGDLVFALSSDGDLVCFDFESGERRWAKNLKKDFGGVMGNWAYAESPLVDGDHVVCAPGGAQATLVALHKRNGEVFWKAPVPGGDKAAYASTIVVVERGVRQYVTLLEKGMVGVEARTGKYLWRNADTTNPASSVPTPVYHDGHIFSTTRGTGGLAKLEVGPDGAVTAKTVYTEKKLANKLGGVVVVNGHVFSAGASTLVCAEVLTGKIKWDVKCVGAASLCYADGCLYVRGEKGEVALVEANAREFVERGRFPQPDRSNKDAWPYPVVANGRLYLRDQGVLLCYDVRAQGP